MGTSCSTALKAVGCTQMAIVVRGINKEEGIGVDEESDHSVDTFREHMRRQAGLPDLSLIKAEEEEQKRRAVLDRSGTAGTRGSEATRDPLKLTRPEQVLEKKVVCALSSSMQKDQSAAFSLKTCFLAGLPSVEHLADSLGAYGRSEKARLCDWQRPNQDEFFFATLKDGYRVGVVVDGHGPDGHRVADVVRDFLFRRVCSTLPSKRADTLDDYRISLLTLTSAALEDAEAMLFSGQEAADVRASGATACIAVYDQKKKWLFCSWLGNCRCVLGEYKEHGAIQARARRTSIGSEGQSSSSRRPGRRPHHITVRSVRFSEDHTLNSAEERVRIASSGAVLIPGPLGIDQVTAPGRDYPAIHFSRCLGDLMSKQLGVIGEPEVSAVAAEQSSGEDLIQIRFVIMGTDGLWQYLRDQVAVEAVRAAGKGNVQYAVSSLVQTAREAWEEHAENLCDFIDDITILVFWL